MDWTTIISEIGGGLPAVVIVGLAVALWHERKRGNEVTDGRLADQKEHTAQILEATRTLDSAIRALEGARRG